MAVRKYKYDGKEYDLDALKKSALANWQGSDKDYRAMVEILQHMTDDEASYADLDKINFGTNYATEKGMFGKDREKSKHYKRAVGYLLKLFLGMSPYEEPVVEAPAKTKASRQWLGSTVLNHLGDVSGYTTDEIRGKELLRALLATLNQLKTGDYDYEDLYGNEVLNGWLTDAIDALGTTDNLDDDNIFWGRVGVINPFSASKSQETIIDPDELEYYKLGGTKEEWNILNLLRANTRMKLFALNKGWVSDREKEDSSLKEDISQQNDSVNTLLTDITNDFEKKLNTGYYENTAKPFIEKNIKDLILGKEHKDWDSINTFMSNLISTLIKGKTVSGTRPTLKSIEYTTENGEKHKAWATQSINTGDYYYAWDPKDNEMVVIEKPKKTSSLKRQKGGYLQILRNN